VASNGSRRKSPARNNRRSRSLPIPNAETTASEVMVNVKKRGLRRGRLQLRNLMLSPAAIRLQRARTAKSLEVASVVAAGGVSEEAAMALNRVKTAGKPNLRMVIARPELKARRRSLVMKTVKGLRMSAMQETDKHPKAAVAADDIGAIPTTALRRRMVAQLIAVGSSAETVVGPGRQTARPVQAGRPPQMLLPQIQISLAEVAEGFAVDEGASKASPARCADE